MFIGSENHGINIGSVHTWDFDPVKGILRLEVGPKPREVTLIGEEARIAWETLDGCRVRLAPSDEPLDESFAGEGRDPEEPE